MNIYISVILCTRNPRLIYLSRVLHALQEQTFFNTQWELLVIDNGSEKPLSDLLDLSWHPNAKVIVETKAGLTSARLRGIQEATGRFLVFVDDDNVLTASYLENALKILADFKQLTAIGAGSILAEFEVEPSAEIRPFLKMLALREESKPHWGNALTFNSSVPYGAGLCVARHVAKAYAAAVTNDPIRAALDRTGNALLSGGDIDLAFFACETGGGTGVFPELTLTHLIPKYRLDPAYLVALADGHAYSHEILAMLWGYKPNVREHWLLKHLRFYKQQSLSRGLARKIHAAEYHGRQRAESIQVLRVQPS